MLTKQQKREDQSPFFLRLTGILEVLEIACATRSTGSKTRKPTRKKPSLQSNFDAVLGRTNACNLSFFAYPASRVVSSGFCLKTGVSGWRTGVKQEYPAATVSPDR
jgi:hypothetical protein